MNPLQYEAVPLATISQPNEKTQELSRLFCQTKKMLLIMNYNDLNDESVKRVLNRFAGNEPSHERPPFPNNNAKEVIVCSINVSTAVRSPKHYENTNKA